MARRRRRKPDARERRGDRDRTVAASPDRAVTGPAYSEGSPANPGKRDVLTSTDTLLDHPETDAHAVWLRAMETFSGTVPDPRDRVLSLFSFIASDHTAAPPCPCLHAGGDVETAERHVLELSRLVDRLCREGGYPPPLGHAIVLMIEGALVEAPVMGPDGPTRDARTAAAMLLAVYETGVGATDF